MALKYTDYLVGQGSGFKISGGLPIDIRSVVEKESYLTIASTWEGSPAYPGLLVSVNETHEVWMFSPDSSIDFDTTKKVNWKKVSAPDLDISGRMVTVIEYNNEKWAKEDGEGEGAQWQPSPGAKPLPQSESLEIGKVYLQLSLNDNDYVYIKSSDIIDLTDYYTKEQVNNLLDNLDSSLVNYTDTAINNVKVEIKDYVDEQDSSLKTYIDGIDSSLRDIIQEFTETVEDEFENINSSITSLKQDVSNLENYVNTSFGEIISDLNGVHDVLDTMSEDIDKIKDYIDVIDSSIEDLKDADTSLNEKIEEVSTRLAELEIGTVDSIESNSQYLTVDTSKGDVKLDLIVIDSSEYQNNGLVTDGWIEEKFAWVELEEELKN